MSEVAELEPDSTERLHDRFIEASRVFLRHPCRLSMDTMLHHYAAFYLAFVCSEEGLNEELMKMRANARNVMAARP